MLPPVPIAVDPSRVLNRIAPAMYGACIEDVNHEIYGGLYDQRIFGESFEEPAPGTSPRGWQLFGGTWVPNGDGVAVRAGDGPKLVREMPPMTDGTVETEVEVSNDMGDNAGLLVRVSNPGVGADNFDGYEISLGANRRQLVLGKHRHDFHRLAAVPAPIVPGRWQRLRVVLNGPRIRVFLDREAAPRIDFVDRDRPLLSGRVALRTWHADASFRDVRIDGEKAPVSLAGEGVSGMWDAVRTGNAPARFALTERAFNGSLCQKIEHGPGSGRVGVANRGLNRWGVAVRRGHPMEGRVYLRGDGPVTVALQSADGRRTYAVQRLVPGRDWKKAPFRLTPTATDPAARFAIWLDRPGRVWVDQAMLFDAPADRFHGLPVRGDIARKLVDGGYTFLRYGGTMINVPGYRWKNMIGDPDRRPPYVGHWYPCSTNGFGIFDFLRFCEAAGFGSAFAINPEETPQDAADLADYLTAPASNPWGRRRAADGRPAPYHPNYIEIGNEEAIGNPNPAALAHYAERFRLLAAAIHRRNPKLKLVCSAWWIPGSPAMKAVFRAVDGVAAAWDLHFWCDDANAGASVSRDLDRAQALFESWNPKTTLKCVVFEENGNRHDLQRALGHATTLNATRRHGDFVQVDCAANCLQPWHENDNGWDQGQVFFTPDRVWGVPPYFAQRIEASNHLPLRVAATAGGGLDVLATRSVDGKALVLTVVNVSDRPVSAKVTFGGFAFHPASIKTLGENGIVSTGRIGSFPAHSLTSIRFVR